MRAGAFHIMDPKGVLEMLLIFLEERGNETPHISTSCSFKDITSTCAGGIDDKCAGRAQYPTTWVNFDGGFQLTLLPGGMSMGCPCDIARSVAQSQSFHHEFCWMESPEKRQRLVRTYDVEGLAVSSTYILETKV